MLQPEEQGVGFVGCGGIPTAIISAAEISEVVQ
jgi:hypothetical protein